MLKLLPITDVYSPQSPVTADVLVRAEVTGLHVCRSDVPARMERTRLNLYCSDGVSGFDKLTPLAVSVISVGSEAVRMLDNACSGRVLAVFKRSFYVQYDDAVFCIGVASLGQGPLHLLIASDEDSLPWTLAPGCRVRLVGNSQRFIADREAKPEHRVADTRARLYHGQITGIALAHRSLKNRQALLDLLAPSSGHGFGWELSSTFTPDDQEITCASTDGMDAVDLGLRRQCFPALRCLYRRLEDSFDARVKNAIGDEDLSQLVTGLLGAGPGLTPAGDDLLAGVMLALHRIGRTDVSGCLWQVLEPHLHARTNLISAAHLRLAARGQCSESVLRMVEHLLDNERATEHSDTLQSQAVAIQTMASQIGASSGWDMLAGTSLVLRALRSL